MSSDLVKQVKEQLEVKTKVSLSDWYDRQAIKNEYTLSLKPMILGYMKIYGKDWSDLSKLKFVNYCISLNLNPFNNDIYMVSYGNTYTPLINFKKFIEIAQSDPNYDGVTYERHFRDTNGSPLPLTDRYIIVRAHYKNGSKPYEKEFSMNEFNLNNGQWKTRPNYMLEKVATKLTLEQAFRSSQVQNLNLYTPEEMVGETSESYDKDIQSDLKKLQEAQIVEEPEEQEENVLNATELLNNA